MGSTSYGRITLGKLLSGKCFASCLVMQLIFCDISSRADPTDLIGVPLPTLLAPSDRSVFKDATERLLQDDSRTMEVRFKLQIQRDGEQEGLTSGVLYQQLEGQGMLMIDREDAQPSHTVWVVKPIGSPRYEYPSPPIILEAGEASEPTNQLPELDDQEPATPFPFTQPISTEPILCRICDVQVPQWYFEKHSETCVEIHHVEAEITECNESIAELRNTIRELQLALEASSNRALEYRGVAIFTPSTSPSMSSPLQLFRSRKVQQMGVKKWQRCLLDQLDEILQAASEIITPSPKEEESKEPIERQRLLSPNSERRITQVRNWCRPVIEDAALTQLAEDAECVMRQKVENVLRMQSTIRYSEKVWLEWQQRVKESLASVDVDSDEGSDDNDSDVNDSGDQGDASTLAAEALESVPFSEGQTTVNASQEVLVSDPTPLASSSPALIGTPVDSKSMSTLSFVPSSWQVINKLPTRSSTPSSISSPLALAVPITATASDEQPPYMDLNEAPGGNATIRTRRSASNLLEPRLLVTPPLSPCIQPRDVQSTRRGHRRYSTVNPIFSPTLSSAPLSPRQPSASTAPVARSTPVSIKDFEIIKPISKGAFGSVFLAKKKVTGDYYAIKVLKKADMIAKNQVTSVKAERMILMRQAESPFVAKLYFTFQSKENLYLVMEYLNGGDCAALLKSIGSLPEEWTRQYIAEVVLGLEYLHERGIVHR